MRRLGVALASTALVFALTATIAGASQPPATTFVAVMTSAQETGKCSDFSNSARGVAVFHVTDETAGTVEWTLVANNLPGTDFAAHIHVGPAGVAGPIVQPLHFTATTANGVIGTGSFSNPALLAAIRANPANYYVNVHTTPDCPAGAIRGQLDTHGPSNQP
jgi:CHRD domain-containing protein